MKPRLGRDVAGASAGDRGPLPRPRELPGFLWFTLLFVLAIGVANGADNHASYLLPGLRTALPDFLPGDWFTWGTDHYHRAFAWLVAGIAETNHLVVGLTVGTVLQSALFAWALYAAIAATYERPLVPWAVALCLFVSLGATSVGDAAWVMPQLEASTLAGIGVVAGLACLAWEKPLWAFLAMGVAGLLHAQFAVLAVPVLAAATWALLTSPDRTAGWKDVIVPWGIFLLLASPSYLTAVRFTTAPGADAIRGFSVRYFPYHQAPWTWEPEPWVVLAGAVSLAAGGLLLRPPSRRRRVFEFALGTIVALVLVSLALGTVPFPESVTAVWPWRLSPLLLLTGFVAAAAALSDRRSWTEPARHAPLGLALVLAGVIAIAHLSPVEVGFALMVLAVLPAVRWARDELGPSDRPPGGALRRGTALLPAMLITVGFLPSAWLGVRESHLQIRAEDAERAPLYEWVRGSTPEEAVFAVPPSWPDVRLVARRSVVADWKAVPMYPPDLIEWLDRIEAVTGIRRPGPSLAALDSAFAELDCGRARRLREEYDVRYVVHRRPKELPCGRTVYADSLFRVWDLAASGE